MAEPKPASHPGNGHPNLSESPLPAAASVPATPPAEVAEPVIEDHYFHLTEGQAVVGAATIAWMVFGLIAGGTLGWIIGARVALGALPLAGLAPLAAGGVGVCGFVFACFFGSVIALAGGTYALLKEQAALKRRRIRARRGLAMVDMLPVLGTAVLAGFMVLTLSIISARALGGGAMSDQSHRVTWNTMNTTRLGGSTPEATALMVYQTAYPATRAQNKPGAVYAVPDDWRIALAMTPLIASPSNAVLVMPGTKGFTTSEREELHRLGFSAAGIRTESETDPVRLAAALDRRYYDQVGLQVNVILVAVDQDFRWGIPAAAYAARTGTPILYVTHDGLPDQTEAELRLRVGHAHMYLMGPESVISGKLARTLTPFGTVTRIGSTDPESNSALFAEFRDESANFGWGHSGRGPRQFTTVNSILVNADRWQDAILGAHLARRGKPGPILLTHGDRFSAAVDNHLWRQKPAFANSADEGPFNHVWIVGDVNRIGYGIQARADDSQEIGQYLTLGSVAASGYEGLAIGWIILALASAIWVGIHAVVRMNTVVPAMKAAWIAFALLLGPAALILYIRSYHRRPTYKADGATHWERPTAGQTVSATVTSFGFDVLLLVLAFFALAYHGYPVMRVDGPFFWFGSALFLAMLFAFAAALILGTTVFHTPVLMRQENMHRFQRAWRAAFPLVLATLAVEALGFIPTLWWQQTTYLPAMQLPTPGDMTMWATLLVAAIAAFLVVLPYNYWAVKTGRKIGTM